MKGFRILCKTWAIFFPNLTHIRRIEKFRILLQDKFKYLVLIISFCNLSRNKDYHIIIHEYSCLPDGSHLQYTFYCFLCKRKYIIWNCGLNVIHYLTLSLVDEQLTSYYIQGLQKFWGFFPRHDNYPIWYYYQLINQLQIFLEYLGRQDTSIYSNLVMNVIIPIVLQQRQSVAVLLDVQ